MFFSVNASLRRANACAACALLFFFCKSPARAAEPPETATSQSAQDAAPDASPPEPLAPNAAKTSGAEEEPNKTSVSFELDFNSRYVFRGIALSRGAVLQPTLTLEKRGYSLGLFANIDASRRGSLSGRNRLDEIDVTFSKSIERGKTTIEPGALFYFYPQSGAPMTGELSLRLARRIGKTTFFTGHALDVINVRGAYFGDIGFAREKNWNDKLSGEAKLSFGFGNATFNAANIGPRRSAAVVAALELSLLLALSEKYYVRPHLAFTRVLAKDLREALGDDADVINAGVALGAEF